MPESGAAGDVRAGVAASPDALQCRTLCRAVGFALASRCMLAVAVDPGERDKWAAGPLHPDVDRGSCASVTCRRCTVPPWDDWGIPKVIRNTGTGDNTQHLIDDLWEVNEKRAARVTSSMCLTPPFV